MTFADVLIHILDKLYAQQQAPGWQNKDIVFSDSLYQDSR